MCTAAKPNISKAIPGETNLAKDQIIYCLNFWIDEFSKF